MTSPLDGSLVLRPPKARALYVFAHGAGAGMRHEFMSAIAERLAEREIASLRFEFPYMAAGRARPDSPAVAEAAARAIFLAAHDRFSELPMFAGGKSFGGRMTSRAHAAEPLPSVRGLIFLGFPLHPPERPSVERADHLKQAAGPLLFLQGTRDELANLELLRPVVAGLGPRASLCLIDDADHGFDVPRRSGRTSADVRVALADTMARWMKRRLPKIVRAE